MTLNMPALVIAALLLAACGKQPTNADGNDPGSADAVGEREAPPMVTPPGIPPGGPTAHQSTDSASEPSETPPPAQ